MADQSIKDLAYRTAASVFGGPVDLATMAMRPFGYKTPDTEVFGSSEYIGKKMEDVGLVSSARSPLTEFLSSIAVPSPATVAKGLSLGAAKSLAMFVGPRSLTWDSLAAGKAKTMEKMGTDARTIWKETGTWKGPDGKWRQEIDDSGSMFRGFGNVDSKSVGEVVHHPKAMAAYPEMAEMRAQSVPGTGGSFVGEMGYAPSSPTVNLGRDSKSGTNSVSLHELQHAVQGREGFALGGMPSTSQYDDPLIALDPVERIIGMGNAIPFKEFKEAFKADRSAFGRYQRLAGEAEARATQARMNMTPEQRRAAFPEESYDVPINQLIIK